MAEQLQYNQTRGMLIAVVCNENMWWGLANGGRSLVQRVKSRGGNPHRWTEPTCQMNPTLGATNANLRWVG